MLYLLTTPYKIIDFFFQYLYLKNFKAYLDHNTMTLFGNKLANARLQTVCFTHRNCKSYKLLIIMTLSRIFYKVKTFALKLSMQSYM